MGPSVKKVLMVSYHFPPEASSSGVLRTLKFSKFLPQFGWVPHVLTLQEHLYAIQDKALLLEIPQEVRIHRTFAFDSIRHFSLFGYHLDFLTIPDRLIGWLPFAIRRGKNIIETEKIDVLFSTSPYPSTHLIAGHLKRATGLPWVADFRDPWIEEGLYPRPGSLRDRMERRWERQVVDLADRVTCTTPRFCRDFVTRYPITPNSKFQVIFNGYDEQDFHAVEPNTPTSYFEILHAGQVNPDFRNPFPLLEAVKALIHDRDIPQEKIRVTFLGGGEYVITNDFSLRIRDLGLNSVVAVVERVPYVESLERQKKATVLLLLQDSTDTNMLIPAKAFEYLRMGRPILALTREGATADLLNEVQGCDWVESTKRMEIQTILFQLYDKWGKGEFDQPVKREIEKYERRFLTQNLANLLNELSEK